jgi:hypothetical protein
MRNKFVTTAALLGAGALLFTGALHILRAGRDDDEKYLSLPRTPSGLKIRTLSRS